MRLLLAEDEPELANWLCRALKQNGYIVDWVDDGRLVEKSLGAVSYDALILTSACPAWTATGCWPGCAKSMPGCRC